MNRRAFLKSGLAMTALAAVPELVHAAAENVVPAAGKPRIRIGLLGGVHSHALGKAQVLLESADYELVGVCEENKAALAQYEKLGLHAMSQEQLLGAAEVLAVESAVQDHARHAKLVLLAGKHLHLEKPPAETLASFQELVSLAKEKRRLMQMGYMWRYNPGINAALEAARKGWLGEIYLVRASINTGLAAERRPEWARFKGGVMFELGSHLIDPVVRLLGRPVEVTPLLKKHGDFPDNLADNTVAVLEFPKATAVISAATLQPGAGPHRFFEILGTNGTAVVKPIEPPALLIDLEKAAGPYTAKSQTVKLPAYRRYMDDFAELASAIRGERSLSVGPDADVLVQETLLRACDM